LFPDHALPRSPYIDLSLSGELGAFRDYILSHGPRIWNSILDSRLPEHLRPHLEELQSINDQFFPEAVERLCQNWTSQASSTLSLVPSQDSKIYTTTQLEANTLFLEESQQGAEGTMLLLNGHNLDVDKYLAEQILTQTLPSPRMLLSKQNAPHLTDHAWHGDMSVSVPDLELMD
jgi:hypothetical protein